MGNTKQVREMLKEHGVSEEEYAEIVKNSGMSKEDYDDLALNYNAPKGITWEEVAKRYQEMHPDINLEEFLDRINEFSPREYILENLTLEKCANEYLSLLEKCHAV